MIGVIAPADRTPAVREFFELFKTPWCLQAPGDRPEVLIATARDAPADLAAPLLILHGCEASPWDHDHGIRLLDTPGPRDFARDGVALHLEGPVAVVHGDGHPILTAAPDEVPVARLLTTGGSLCLRLGFDLWSETDRLLRTGQDPRHAATPVLDLLIALLRDAILNAGLPLVEIPPHPYGHPFIACLTHDVDHPSLRRHRWDHTAAGYLRRATLDTSLQAVRGRCSVADLGRNYRAAFAWPLVQIGLASDPWLDFPRYATLEHPDPSTFFVIPKRGVPGRRLSGAGSAPSRRASGYAARDITPQLEQIQASGCEIALHGLDAWADPELARAEAALIPHRTTASEQGVRMHWLYRDESTPATLDAAGFTYDSTFGYNPTVGYRAGTSCVFRPPGVARLLELPLHIMDTALFYPSYLGLTTDGAADRITPIIDHAVRSGGVVTVNWHDRSLFPERNWGAFYVRLLGMLRAHQPWFATAGRVVAWFRRRREASFQADASSARVTSPEPSGMPPLFLRHHAPRPGLRERGGRLLRDGAFRDQPLAATPSP